MRCHGLITLVTLIAACLVGFAVSAAAEQPLKVVILAGQSNAQGWMGDGRLYPQDAVDARIPFRWVVAGHNPMLPGDSQHGDGWGPLGPQNGICGFGNPASHFGPEIGMARALARDGHRVAVIKVTIGNSSLYGDWKLAGQGGLTDAMLAEVALAMADLAKSGQKARVRGLVWIQGESDSCTEASSAGFQELLTRLIADLRHAWGDPALPVVLGLDEQNPFVVARPQVIAAQQAIATADARVAWTSMVGLEKADTSHLTAAALPKHGERIAEALQTLWKAESAKRR